MNTNDRAVLLSNGFADISPEMFRDRSGLDERGLHLETGDVRDHNVQGAATQTPQEHQGSHPN